jgi:hypothetical protein
MPAGSATTIFILGCVQGHYSQKSACVTSSALQDYTVRRQLQDISKINKGREGVTKENAQDKRHRRDGKRPRKKAAKSKGGKINVWHQAETYQLCSVAKT